jgi:hypothetical protein
MALLNGPSGRLYAPLPIDGSLGFPQSFALLFASRNYRFRLYVNANTPALQDKNAILNLPFAPVLQDKATFDVREAFLVVRVDLDQPTGESQLIFVRKVVPDLEYEFADVALFFPQQCVAVQNLNGQGNFGTQVTGGIALQ